VWLVLTKTKLGIALRATAQDAEIANLMGISVPRTLLITMGIATALAAIAAVAVAPLWVVYPYMWNAPLVMVLVIVVLGGLGSIKGSIIGAFIVALVEVLVATLMPSGAYLKVMFAMLVMIIVLVVRPGGLFGIVFEEERL
jgi:branched-chain amino acid transport system permease protein